MAAKIQTLTRTVRGLVEDRRFDGFADPHGLLDFPPWKLATYRENPYLVDLDSPCQLIGVRDSRVIGRRNSYPGRIVADGVVYDTRISGSVYVDPACRSSLYAVSLLEQALKFPNGDLNINCGLSPQNQKFYMLLGSAMFPLSIYEAGGRWSRYYKGRQTKLWKKIVANVINAFLACLNCICDRCRWKDLPRWKIKELDITSDCVLEEFCDLIRRDSHKYRQEITPEWIRWTLRNDFITPNARKYLLGVYDGEVLVGFAMTRTDPSTKESKVFEWQLDQVYEGLEGEFLCTVAKWLCSFGSHVKVIVGEDSGKTIDMISKRFPLLYRNFAVVTIADESRFCAFDGIKDSLNWRVRPGMGDAPFW